MLIGKLNEYMQLKDYSRKTIAAYTNCAKILYAYFKKPLGQISEQEFKRFLADLAKKGYSPYTLNLYHASLKLVFEKIYQIPFNFNLPYAKRAKKLPVVLSREEVRQLIDVINNPKHKVMIALSYGSGAPSE